MISARWRLWFNFARKILQTPAERMKQGARCIGDRKKKKNRLNSYDREHWEGMWVQPKTDQSYITSGTRPYYTYLPPSTPVHRRRGNNCPNDFCTRRKTPIRLFYIYIRTSVLTSEIQEVKRTAAAREISRFLENLRDDGRGGKEVTVAPAKCKYGSAK